MIIIIAAAAARRSAIPSIPQTAGGGIPTTRTVCKHIVIVFSSRPFFSPHVFFFFFIIIVSFPPTRKSRYLRCSRALARTHRSAVTSVSLSIPPSRRRCAYVRSVRVVISVSVIFCHYYYLFICFCFFFRFSFRVFLVFCFFFLFFSCPYFHAHYYYQQQHHRRSLQSCRSAQTDFSPRSPGTVSRIFPFEQPPLLIVIVLPSGFVSSSVIVPCAGVGGTRPGSI